METQPLFNQSIEMNRESEKSVDITQEDKERFFKSILADVPYDEVITLFDGQLKIKLRAMTVRENSDVVNQIVADKKNGVAAENDAYLITISTYRLGLSLVSIDDQQYSTITKDNFQALTENDTYVLARARPMLNWGTTKLAVFLDAFKAFEYKTIRLSSEVQTANFWRAST